MATRPIASRAVREAWRHAPSDQNRERARCGETSRRATGPSRQSTRDGDRIDCLVAVHFRRYWHFADMKRCPLFCRYRGHSGIEWESSPRGEHGTETTNYLRNCSSDRGIRLGKTFRSLEMSSSRATYYRRQADVCLRLSMLADNEMSDRMIAMAQRYSANAEAVDRDSEHSNSRSLDVN